MGEHGRPGVGEGVDYRALPHSVGDAFADPHGDGDDVLVGRGGLDTGDVVGHRHGQQPRAERRRHPAGPLEVDGGAQHRRRGAGHDLGRQGGAAERDDPGAFAEDGPGHL